MFSAIDATVQALTIFIQIFVTGQMARRLGVTVLLTAVPVLMMFGFGLLALAATFPVLVVVMIAAPGRRICAGPGRAARCCSPASTPRPSTRRRTRSTPSSIAAATLLSAWANAGIVAVGSTLRAAFGGMAIAAVWAVTGYRDRPARGRAVAARAD